MFWKPKRHPKIHPEIHPEMVSADAGISEREITVCVLVPVLYRVRAFSEGPTSAAARALEVIGAGRTKGFSWKEGAAPAVVTSIECLDNPGVFETVPEQYTARVRWCLWGRDFACS